MRLLLYSTHCLQAPMHRSLARFVSINKLIIVAPATSNKKTVYCLNYLLWILLCACSGPGNCAELGLADGGVYL